MAPMGQDTGHHLNALICLYVLDTCIRAIQICMPMMSHGVGVLYTCRHSQMGKNKQLKCVWCSFTQLKVQKTNLWVQFSSPILESNWQAQFTSPIHEPNWRIHDSQSTTQVQVLQYALVKTLSGSNIIRQTQGRNTQNKDHLAREDVRWPSED